MEKIIGQIQKVDITNGMNSMSGKAWERYTFHINEKKYSTFNKDFSKFKVGQIVEVTLEQNGKYQNIVDMQETTKTPTQTTNTQMIVTTAPADDKSQAIVDVLRLILAELKSLDVDRTIWAKPKAEE
jgi:hypothetical protein